MTQPNTTLNFDHEYFEALAQQIQAIELGSVFTITPDGGVVRHEGIYAPEVWHVEGAQHPDDIEIEPQFEKDKWTALAGFTGQYSYNGAVNHSSEFVGCSMASALYDADEPQTYVMVSVEVRREDAYPEEMGDPAPAGWAILRYGKA